MNICNCCSTKKLNSMAATMVRTLNQSILHRKIPAASLLLFFVDYIAHHTERSQGVRILTVFLYLNDVEEGGGTRFTDLDITVAPKTGRVLIWPCKFPIDPSACILLL